MSSHDKEAARAAMACKGCGKDHFFCECPPPAMPARPAWKDTYPPLHCLACGAPFQRLPTSITGSIGALAHLTTCSEACKKEIEYRYYNGAVLNRPYQRPEARLTAGEEKSKSTGG